MLPERSMVKIRWLALGSAIAFFAILNVKQIRGLLILIAAGVLYNLFLSSSSQSDIPEKLKNLSTLLDVIGLSLLVFFTGGPGSVFVLYMAVYLFMTTLRHGLVSGLGLAVLATAGLSYYYFTDPTGVMQTAVFTRGLLFMIAPLGASLLDLKPAQTPTSTAKASESEPVLQAEEKNVSETAELPPALAEKVEVVEEPAVTPEPPTISPPAIPDLSYSIAETVADTPSSGETPESSSANVTEDEPGPRDEMSLPEQTPVVAEASEAVETTETAKDKVLTDVVNPGEAEFNPKMLAEEIGFKGDTMSPGLMETHVLREKLTELATLHEASKALGASLILEEVIDTVVDISAKGLLADIAGALIFDEKTGLLTIASLRGFTSEEREVINSTSFTPGEGLLGDVYTKKKTLNIDDLSQERPGSAPFNGRIKSFIAAPLATDGYDIGVLFLGKFIVEPFTSSAEEFTETISGQAAIAVENARLYTQAQELAIHNGLTGIYNYRYFMRQLDEEIKRAERYGRSVSLMMIDIDLFKHVNDNYGHQRGDEVLKGLAHTLVNTTRETDVVARYGGEEFCVILPETELDAALDVAEKLRTSVAKASYAREKGQSLKITVSLGVATYPAVANNQEELLRQADDALYAAKTKRNVVVSAGAGTHPV